MKKPFKKTLMIASALTIGMAVFSPFQVGVASAEKTIEASVQKEQQIKGTIKFMFGDSCFIKGDDGKFYYVGLQKFADEQIEQMNLVEGQQISVEGSVLKDSSEFYTFEVYKKNLPKEISKEDLKKLEIMYKEMQKLEQEKKYDEADEMYQEMHKIIKPYELANWMPESFEEYIATYEFNGNSLVIKESDNDQLKVIYEEWIKLEKGGKEEEASKKLDEFYKILDPYLEALYPPQTFEEFIAESGLKDLPEDVLTKLKTNFEEQQKALKDDNDELYEKLWDEYYQLIRPYINSLSFDEYMSDIYFEISTSDKEKLKEIYEEAIVLDRNGEDEKAEGKWEAFHTILDPYYEANKEILIFASKLTINGHDYLPQH
ncbi:hypothetical protein FOH38_16040 [Lysinibacillus fusiformis]|nr:hypothetical protein FOH38_16040 [Lysinibacillus fusiformis]